MTFVLGAKGFVGATVLEELRALDECVGIDIDNYDEHVGRECDVVVNVNGNSKKFLAADQPALEFDMSVRSVVHSIYDFPCGKYVYVSSVDVYTDFATPEKTAEDAPIDNARRSAYGFHKWLAEQYVMKMCDSWLITRLGGMVGPGLKKGPVYDLINGATLRVHLDSRYQYIPTRAVGQVIRHLLRENIENEVFNVCGTGTVSLRQVREWLGTPARETPGLEKQHYEINNEKLRGVFDVPETSEAVKAFLREEGLV